MISLNCLSIGKPYIIVSTLPSPNSNSSSSPSSLPKTNNTSSIPKIKVLKQQNQQQKQKQPTVAEIERAIGAGIFRDRDTQREDNKTLFDTILINLIGKKEGSVEKKLRETGEWLLDRTERNSRSTGKKILVFVFIWILPTWIFALLVASGSLKLPFDIPVLDDLIL